MSILAAAVATAAFVAVSTLSANAHRSMRRSMLKMGHDVLVLPAGASIDPVAPDFGRKTLPQETADRLAAAPRLPVGHLMALLQKRITIDEVAAAAEDGSLTEAFGAGTAAVISPVGEFCYKGKSIMVNNGQTGKLSQRLFDGIQALQRGMMPDEHNWLVRVA